LITNIYPWLYSTWSQLWERRRSLPHALLLTGRQGIGKQDLAIAFARSLLCRAPEPDGRACERCEACHWFARDAHPDFRLITPESDEPGEERAARASRVVRIDQIRALQEWLAVGAHQSGWRVGVLAPAEAMNANAANALLKTLEEPPPLNLLILVSHQPSRLLPTVRSRCQQILCPVPDAQQAQAWLREQGVENPAMRLALSSGAPLPARASAGQEEAIELFVAAVSSRPLNIFSVAPRLAVLPLSLVIDLLQKWIYDLCRAGSGVPLRYFEFCRPQVEGISREAQPARLFELDRRVAEARRLVDHPLQPRLVVEDLLAAYVEAIACSSTRTAI